MSLPRTPLKDPLVCSLLIATVALITPAALGQQAPPEKPTCKSGEVLKDNVCVPKNPVSTGPRAQSDPETAPAVTPNPARIPRCKKGEELVGGVCVHKE